MDELKEWLEGQEIVCTGQIWAFISGEENAGVPERKAALIHKAMDGMGGWARLCNSHRFDPPLGPQRAWVKMGSSMDRGPTSIPVRRLNPNLTGGVTEGVDFTADDIEGLNSTWA